uniref:Uncharacterized protein n=1 Tax=Eutreptiella gymnastica TaxID=73025 RepID=A0A7S1IB71_9EUGL|mmetsp:Transcript_143826/g.251066  ORF Transcript_143826/g.251066 Transcript_143826/m.251066 type:complete len:119 (+) Transcript_143826:123-479(+)
MWQDTLPDTWAGRGAWQPLGPYWTHWQDCAGRFYGRVWQQTEVVTPYVEQAQLAIMNLFWEMLQLQKYEDLWRVAASLVLAAVFASCIYTAVRAWECLVRTYCPIDPCPVGDAKPHED